MDPSCGGCRDMINIEGQRTGVWHNLRDGSVWRVQNNRHIEVLPLSGCLPVLQQTGFDYVHISSPGGLCSIWHLRLILDSFFLSDVAIATAC